MRNVLFIHGAGEQNEGGGLLPRELRAGLGADIEATDDGFVVRGTGSLRGGRISSHGDHRLAMLGAIAGLASEEGVEVDGMEAAAVSYPAFEDDLKRLAG